MLRGCLSVSLPSARPPQCPLSAHTYALDRLSCATAHLLSRVLRFRDGGAGVFFALILFNDALVPMITSLGTTPLMLAVFVGAAQNIISKGSKYSLFDPCKEMAYIPLDAVSTRHTAEIRRLVHAV